MDGPSTANPHRFRHTFATRALKAEARTLDVQLLLRHSTPAMVRRYAATYNAEKAARANTRWSPRDRLEQFTGEVPSPRARHPITHPK